MENNINKANIAKHIWAVENGFENWAEFISKTRQLNSSPPDAIICIPETIIDELLEMVL